MIHATFLGAVMRLTFDDEQLPGIWRPGGNDGRIRMLLTMLEGRGDDNPKGLASFNPETGESVFFDVLSTPEVENSHEILLMALAETLAWLRGAPAGPDKGGFGTDEMSKWLWGLRHQAKFESILSEFLDAGSDYAFLADLFAVDTKVLPLAEGMAADDPRKGLRWFPRPGDQSAVDAGNPGLSGTNFTYGSGPVMRMVVALGGGEVEGLNIVPGGQSGLTDSPHFHDQLELWLGNQALPMRFFVSDVVEGATTREEYVPMP
jgi:penicillin amidase